MIPKHFCPPRVWLLIGMSLAVTSASAGTEVCDGPAILISEIQGSGESPNLLGQTVTVQAVVIGDYQNDAPDQALDLQQLNGFYVQEEATDQDHNPATSEGLFVFEDGRPDTDVAEGDLVRVRGVVANAYNQTQLLHPQVLHCKAGEAIEPVPLTIPLPPHFSLEQVEGMLVSFAQPLTVSDTDRLIEFGEIKLSQGRLPVPTSVVPPGAAAQAQVTKNKKNQLILDDGRDGKHQRPFAFGLSATNVVRTGDTVTGLTGVLGYGFHRYRLRPTQKGVHFGGSNPRPEGPPVRRGKLRIAAFNTQNFFSTIDQNNAVCGPAEEGCRGADSEPELARQLNKLTAAISLVDADIVGLIELENNATGSLKLLTDALNQLDPNVDSYAYLNTGVLGRDVIKVGFLYRPARVSLKGRWAVLDSSAIKTYDANLNRPMLAQTFADRHGALTVAVAHWKSKSCSSAQGANARQSDGQACYNPVRTAAAQAAAAWLATDPTGSGDPDFLIMGDLNAYALETPVTTLVDAGYTDLVRKHSGSDSYSFEYRGEAGYLDHALANASLSSQVGFARFYPINADEPRAFDFNEEPLSEGQAKPESFFSSSPFRSSDHDPVIIDLNLQGAIHSDNFE